MYATAAGHDNGFIFLPFLDHVSFAEFKFEFGTVDDAGWRAHDAQVDQASVPVHDPFHDAQQLLRAGGVNNLQMSDAIEDRNVIVAHVCRAIGASLKVWTGGEHG